MIYQIRKSDRSIAGEIQLDGSKSLSNRILIIRALSGHDFDIHHLSTSKDTVTLNKLLQQKTTVLDAGAAGTTFRFMTAFLALQQGSQTLTGSERMKQRPIGVLVDALRQLGASIDYLEKEGYPPLMIHSPKLGFTNKLNVSANISSQFISGLLMIAPVLPKGLELTLEGTIVSRPYIEMTLNLMHYFGVNHNWEGNTITIEPQKYQSKTITVEADWSAASYYYTMAAFSDELDLNLVGLYENSLQGDAVCAQIMQHFGIHTSFSKTGIHLRKQPLSGVIPPFEWNFITCPDIAQSLAVVCGGLGIAGQFTGLETLKIKETDRIAALQHELSKVKVNFSESQEKDHFFDVEGKANLSNPVFETYEDHRMAMAFAPLGMLGPISVEDPGVVVKSYPDYWKDIEKLGFRVEEQ